MTTPALDTSKKIKNLKTQDIGVIDIFKINFNLKKILLNNKKLKNIITIEEHLLEGGLGSIFAEYLFDYSLNKKISLKRFGINISNAYSYASREKIHDLNGITVSKIIKKI
jgi:transketolase C-terminal domain/subunit